MSDVASPLQYQPTKRDRVRWAINDWKRSIIRGLDAVARRVGYVRMERNSNYVSFAQREFKAAGWDLSGDSMQRLMCDQVCELLRVFATHGHSGSSAPYAVSLFTSLAKFEPLVPLTGENWEWNEVSEGMWQNNRCFHVFKDISRFDGQPYDSQAVIFRYPDGGCFTSGRSARVITFPYTPERDYVNVPAP